LAIVIELPVLATLARVLAAVTIASVTFPAATHAVLAFAVLALAIATATFATARLVRITRLVRFTLAVTLRWRVLPLVSARAAVTLLGALARGLLTRIVAIGIARIRLLILIPSRPRALFIIPKAVVTLAIGSPILFIVSVHGMPLPEIA
jgi:hypothetical protein